MQSGIGCYCHEEPIRPKATVLGQNGTDKMVYGQNGIGQNGMDKMARTKWYG